MATIQTRLGILVTLLFFVGNGLAAAASSDNEVSEPQQIDGRVAGAIHAAVNDFQKSQKNMACFSLSYEVVDLLEKERGDFQTVPGNQYVKICFVPKQPGGDVFHSGGKTPCGWGVTYLIGKTNRVAKKWYAR